MTPTLLTLPATPSPGACQKSLARPRPSRGRTRADMRRAHVHHWTDCPVRRRDEFLMRWSRLMVASFADARACADWAGVTAVCAHSWMDGMHRPCGDVVARAALKLPRFAEIMGDQP